MTDPRRSLILGRRAKFVAAALTGLSVASCSQSAACLSMIAPDTGSDSASDVPPEACLSPVLDTGTDVFPEACLDVVPDTGTDVPLDVSPEACLDVVPDTGITDTGTADVTPEVCLSPPPPDSGAG